MRHLYKAFATIFLLTTSILLSCNESDVTDQETQTATEAFVNNETDEEYSTPITKFRIGIASLPFKQRIEVFNSLDNEMKAALWRDRLSEALASGMSAKKKNAIENIIPLITPELYATQKLNTSEEQIATWKKNAFEAFGDDTLRLLKYITLLGDPVKGINEQFDDTTNVILQESIKTTDTTGTQGCDCNVSANSCFARSAGTTCRAATNPCDISMIGCGMFGLMSCDGRCAQ